ncbi:amidohydrolase family protein [Rhabdochromatium marinum]|uniref:amidohydrolase family protein n=1 Tax=Rhabdochromatium marinum TaxID=48729 RepID=UPI001905BAC2|nr:amidohydrolase family protein [Rhabdochromatium marinum]
MVDKFELFDSHLHIIDPRYPLVPNNGYVPEPFTHEQYLTRLSKYNVIGGAIVSGSFQAFDQGYLISALNALGPSFVGVTQLPYTTPDEYIIELHSCGVKALRFNLYRGGSKTLKHMVSMAKRVHELVGWHIELYVDSTELDHLFATIIQLPSVTIDHLGMSKTGFSHLLKLAEKDVKIKATGFGRINFDAAQAIIELYNANPDSLMFGTDLPSTRAPIPFQDSDISMVADTLSFEAATKVFSTNAIEFYKYAG